MPSRKCAARCGVVTLTLLLVVAMPGIADEPPSRATGVPGTTGTALGLTREELLQRWDLDGDGSISKSEADISRARMRRTRIELQLGTGIDPLTGLPRDAATAEPAADEDAEQPRFQLPPEPQPSRPRSQADALPGLRAPATRPPAPTAPTAARPTTPAGLPATTSPPQPLSARASWLPPQRSSPTATGGVRAGAPAAVPGYGSGAWSDLNAGRRPMPQGSDDATRKPSGGLLPSVRPPGRTGAIILPTVPGRPATAAAPALPQAPAVRSTAPPRITADEIGAERP